MPPKKKKGGKKKKKKDDGELTVDDKYKKTLEEIDALKDHLTFRKELARRSQADSREWRGRMENAEKQLEEHSTDQRAVGADMTRQYKTMQTEMGLKIHQLEGDLSRTREKLDYTEAELKKTKEEKERLCREKDDQIADLTLKINSMGIQYESVLHDAMDNLIQKIGSAKQKWEHDTTKLQSKNKQALLDLGLHPLDI